MWILVATCFTATVGHAAPFAYAIKGEAIGGNDFVLGSLDLGTGVFTTIGILTALRDVPHSLALSPSGQLYTSTFGTCP